MAACVEPLRTEQDALQCAPSWAWKLLRRVAALERGNVYTLTVVMLEDTPVWSVQASAKLENGHKENISTLGY